jgi:hypothetical protein
MTESRTGRQSQAKRHHYVPKSYLLRFADSRGKIAVYDRRMETKPHITSPANAAVRRPT